MVRTFDRLGPIAVILVIAALLTTGFVVVEGASAAPRKVNTSMNDRVKSQRDLCETIGGGDMDYVNSYEDGKLVGVTTTCVGGTEDGWNCANTETTIDCWQSGSRTIQPPVFVQDLPGIASEGATPVVPDSPVSGLPVVVIEDSANEQPAGDVGETGEAGDVTVTGPQVTAPVEPASQDGQTVLLPLN